MKRRILLIIACVLLLAGLGFLLFPPVSNLIGNMRSNAAADELEKNRLSITDGIVTDEGETVSSYEEAIARGLVDEKGRPVTSDGLSVLFEEDIERLKKDSLDYNEWLFSHAGEYETTQYENAVFFLEDYGIFDGVYCYITAEKIGLRLPVYLGASEYLMSYGAAHLYGTSLPVGAGEYHAAIAGHTGYVGRIFFDNLRALSVGDTVTVTTYWGEDVYTVRQTRVVEENDAQALQLQKGRQLLTLITCISDPEGGFDRYLVICEKTDS